MYNCPKCGNPLDTYESKNFKTGKITIVGTCREKTCNRRNITLSIDRLMTLTDEEASEYKQYDT